MYKARYYKADGKKGKARALRSASVSMHNPLAFWIGVLRLFALKGPRKLANLNRPNHEIL